jgi:hypothetical protein
MLMDGHMPFENQYGFVVCRDSGIASHSYFGSEVEVTAWKPEIILGDQRLSELMPLLDHFSVVCNPVLWDGHISFTACTLEDDKPASYFLYTVSARGLTQISSLVTFSGFSLPDQKVRITSYNTFSYRGVNKSLNKDEQIIRIVPCHDPYLLRYDPLILTILNETTGDHRSALYRGSDRSIMRLSDELGGDVYKPTIFNGVMTHVIKDGSRRLLKRSSYLVS